MKRNTLISLLFLSLILLSSCNAAEDISQQASAPTPAEEDTLRQASSPAPAKEDTLQQASAPTPAEKDTLRQTASPTPAKEDTLRQAASPTPTAEETAFFFNSEDSPKKMRLENDFCRIWCKPLARGAFATVFENLDGTGQREIEEDFSGYELWLTSDWFYYHTYNAVYRIPVSYRHHKAVLKNKKKEKLFSGKDFSDIQFLVTADFILYSDYIHEKDYFFRYNLKTGKTSRLFDMPSEAQIITDLDTDLPLIQDRSFFMTGTNTDQGVYRVSLDTMERTVIYQGETGEKKGNDSYYLPNSCMAAYGDSLYFAPDGEKIIRYDREREQTDCVLSKNTLKQLLSKKKLWGGAGEQKSDICYLYAYQNRLYIMTLLEWNQKEAVKSSTVGEKQVRRKYDRNVLLSADFSNLDTWREEKAFCRYLSSHAWRPKGKNGGTGKYYCTESFFITNIRNGKIFFEMIPTSRQKQKLYRSMLYDIGRGKIKKRKEKCGITRNSYPS